MDFESHQEADFEDHMRRLNVEVKPYWIQSVAMSALFRSVTNVVHLLVQAEIEGQRPLCQQTQPLRAPGLICVCHGEGIPKPEIQVPQHDPTDDESQSLDQFILYFDSIAQPGRQH